MLQPEESPHSNEDPALPKIDIIIKKDTMKSKRRQATEWEKTCGKCQTTYIGIIYGGEIGRQCLRVERGD